MNKKIFNANVFSKYNFIGMWEKKDMSTICLWQQSLGWDKSPEKIGNSIIVTHWFCQWVANDKKDWGGIFELTLNF